MESSSSGQILTVASCEHSNELLDHIYETGFLHFLSTVGSQMAVRLLALRTSPLYPRKFLVLISVRG
jgi:hypothetical protein